MSRVYHYHNCDMSGGLLFSFTKIFHSNKRFRLVITLRNQDYDRVTSLLDWINCYCDLVNNVEVVEGKLTDIPVTGLIPV